MSDNVIEFLIKARDEFSTAFSKVEHSLNAAAGAVFSLKGALVGLGIGAVAKSFVDAGNEVDSLRIRLNTLMGSAQQGNQVFQDMTKYASQVPFQYENIMQGATQLAGVVQGGAAGIAKWMPLIGDLAATTGLSIQETTDQVSRMMSAGAASADLFRQRGVLAMLGFQAGVNYTADETRKKLMDAWTSPMSRFRGATSELANTLPGIFSMIEDKWFLLRSAIMESGILNYIKAIATVINDYLGKALDATKNNVKDLTGQVTEFGRSTFDILGKIGDMLQIIEMTWKAFEVIIAAVVAEVYKGIDKVTQAYVTMRQMFSKHYEAPFAIQVIHASTEAAIKRVQDLKNDIKDIHNAPWASDKIAVFQGQVENAYKKIQQATKAMNQMGPRQGPSVIYSQGTGAEQDAASKAAVKAYAALEKHLESQKELVQQTYEDNTFTIEDAYQNQLIDFETYSKRMEQLEEQHQAALAATRDNAIKGSYDFARNIRQLNYLDAMKNGSDMLKGAAQNNRLAFTMWKALALARATVSLPSAVIESFENGGGYPWGLVPATIMALKGAAEIAKINSTHYTGQAHAGLTNVPREGTYLLQQGERVLAPTQNRDLTQFLNGQGQGGNAVQINELHFHLFENATNADALLRMDSATIREVVAEKFIPAMDSLYKQGVVPEAYSRFKQ